MLVNNTEAVIILTIVLLFVVIGSLVQARQNRINDQRWIRRSNARVIREFQQISIHRPHHIINEPYREDTQ